MKRINDIAGCGKNSRGFSVMEIITVLLVLGIISAVAVTRITSTKIYTVVAEMDILKTNLRYAQFRALSDADNTSADYTVNNATWGIKLSGNTYILQHNGADATTKFPGDDSNTHTLPSGITISGSSVTFDVWGSPGVSDITITVTDGTSPQIITVTRKTGFIP